MGIFNNSKITIKKEIQNNETKIYVDYHKLKKPNDYKSRLIKDLIGENNCLVVIDTKLVYINKSKNVDNQVNVLMEFLDDNSINYRKMITKRDNNFSLLGVPIKMGNSPQKTDYIIGFVISSGEIDKIKSITDKFNAIIYIVSDDISIDEPLNIFYTARGDMEELNNKYPYNIYNDNFFYITRICSDNEKVKSIEDIINRMETDGGQG